jgi:hypothetical protein
LRGLQKKRKILSALVKVLVGLGSLAIIYYRIKGDLTPERSAMLLNKIFSPSGLFYLAVSLLLIPLNWGIESYKWKVITAPIQWISFRTATKSVYAGVCLGNLAPGRATEFLAKIIFFKIDNRPKITVLHFVGGMFQLSITIIAGFFALMLKLNDFEGSSTWMKYVTPAVGLVLMLLLALSIRKINWILNFVSKRISHDKNVEDFDYHFTAGSLIKLFGFSAIRYAVFFIQFYLLIFIFDREIGAALFPGIALYFLVTSTIPMISVLEAPIRAAIALVVFKDSGISETALALSSALIWMINIIIPSIFGYYILLRQNFNFKLFRTKPVN